MRDLRSFLYGGVASVVAETGTFPIDTTKTRLQVQGQVLDKQVQCLRYRGMVHAVVSIASEEGVISLYRGIAPAILRQACYGTIRIGAYDCLKRWFSTDGIGNGTSAFAKNLACGVVAGMMSSAVANPTDVLKVRMQMNNSYVVKMTMIQAFTDIYRREGLRGLWRGVGPTTQRAALLSGVSLSIYDLVKDGVMADGVMDDNEYCHLLSGVVAGFAGAVVSNPVDVIKTRLMNQRNLRPCGMPPPCAIYSNSVDCLRRTVKGEGVLALFKGFVPTWFRIGPWNIIFFLTYEKLKNMRFNDLEE